MSEEKLRFKAEVAKLLNIVVNSFYSEKEIFLRELISNSSDACDKLRYMSLTKPHLAEDTGKYGIWVIPDKKERTLVIADNGVGMNRDDLVDNLGTIARSGSEEFVNRITGDKEKDLSLIGQFGVGFYSAFMVADKVEVKTKKAGEEKGWKWVSDGTGEFTISEEKDVERGTRIKLFLKKDQDKFVNPIVLRQIVRTYSDHIALPVVLVQEGKEEETMNSASALWTRSKSEVTKEQYKEFYHHSSHAFDEPWLTMHYKAEGSIEYTSLLFIPSEQPYDLFQPDRKPQLKLYINRVFITDDCTDMLPSYLRFVRGVVDSADLPLNISREFLQQNPVLTKIRNGIVRRLLSELKKKSADKEEYKKFWDTFGAVMKEGLYEDFERRDDIAKLCRFNSTIRDELISFEDYIEKMPEGQDAIYYLTGEDVKNLKNNPQIEGFTAKGIEVLLLTDPIDEFWPQSMPVYDGKPIKSVAVSAADLGKVKTEDKEESEDKDAASKDEIDALILRLKDVLGSEIKEIRISDRLTESPVCLVSAEGEASLHLERLMRQHRLPMETGTRILEINPKHILIKHLAERTLQATEGEKESGDLEFSDAARLLLDQARIIEGEAIPDPIEFARRLTRIMEKGACM